MGGTSLLENWILEGDDLACTLLLEKLYLDTKSPKSLLENWILEGDDLACTLLLEKLYLDAKSPCVYTVYGRKISLHLVGAKFQR